VSALRTVADVSDLAAIDAKLERLVRAVERLDERLAVDSAPVAVTKARAARELEVSTKTIERMVRQGQLSVVVVRGRPRIPFAELLRIAKPPESAPRPTRLMKFDARQEAQTGRQALRRLR
jgi:excisionase family DNA binding protein